MTYLTYPERIKNRIAETYYKGLRVPDIKAAETLVDKIRIELNRIDSLKDKVELISFVLEQNERAIVRHHQTCPNPAGCAKHEGAGIVHYFLEQELNRLGIKISEDVFTAEEKVTAEHKLDEVWNWIQQTFTSLQSDLNSLKAGQQVIYEDMAKEMADLKKDLDMMKGLLYLGKKTWKQLLLGKISELLISSSIGEVINKPLAKSLSEQTSTIFENLP